MTKWRNPYGGDSAMVEIIHALGDLGAAEIVNRTDGLIRQWADPDNEAEPKMFSQALYLDIAFVNKTGKPAPLLNAYRSQLERYARHDPIPVDSVEQESLDVAAAAGDLCRHVREARQDGKISREEARRLLKHCADLDREVREVRQIAEAVLDDSSVVALPHEGRVDSKGRAAR